MSYKAVEDRFGHIDGEIVSIDYRSDSRLKTPSVRIVVRFYAWWEHPQYVAAVEAGDSWGVDWEEDACREMSIEAVAPALCRFGTGTSATDLCFFRNHPDQWEFEDSAQILCNSSFEAAELFEAVLRRKIPHVNRGVLLRHLGLDSREAPYSLGYLPHTLFGHVKDALRELGVKVFIPREPEKPRPLVSLFIDENVEVVAEDFLLDVPEFDHRPEWFNPGA